ncbi:MAG TPA: hypothetical protein VFW53_03055 [Gallionella sp.]|nr:hypothetical protein [Gallionella sp.]
MKNTDAVLHLTVGEPEKVRRARASAALKAARLGKAAKPYFGIDFDDVGEMLAVFAPKRWELIGALRESGATTVAELARLLRRDYKSVHNDCERLIYWSVIEKDENGLLFVPYAKVAVDMHLPDKRAA